jgi:DtxR family Mn-dependent transcriptional regulator
MTSASVENYLKAIYQLQSEQGVVSTTALADALSVSAASVSNMVKKLAAMKLATHSPYRGVVLTREGEMRALEMIRHHRLIELFLSETLGVPWDQVHVEAEKMEHVISEDLEARIAKVLGNPKFDPHGDPIPSKDGRLPKVAQLRLTDLEVGERATIARVSDQNAEHLQFLNSRGLQPGVQIVILQKIPFEGPLRIRVGNHEHLLSSAFGESIFVRRLSVPREENLTKKNA